MHITNRISSGSPSVFSSGVTDCFSPVSLLIVEGMGTEESTEAPLSWILCSGF